MLIRLAPEMELGCGYFPGLVLPALAGGWCARRLVCASLAMAGQLGFSLVQIVWTEQKLVDQAFVGLTHPSSSDRHDQAVLARVKDA